LATSPQPTASPIHRFGRRVFSRQAAPYWAVFGIALAIRALDQSFVDTLSPTFGQLWPDSVVYDRWAREIAQSFWFGWERFPSIHGPLYPYFLGLLYLRFGADIAVAVWSQRLLGALTVVLLFWLGRRVFGKRAGWFTAIGAALCPTFLLYESEILVETLVLFLHVATLCLFTVAAERKNARWWIAAGVMLGLCCLGRPNALLLLPPLALWGCLIAPGNGIKRFLPAAAMAAATAVTISPATLANTFVGGRFHLISATGAYNLYIGNAPDATGIFASPPSANDIRAREGKPDEDIAWRGHLREALREEPMALPRNLWLKTQLFWQSGEIPSGPNYYLQRAFSPLLHSPFRWAVIAPLGLLGIGLMLARDRPRRWDDPRVLLLGWLIVFMAGIVMVFVMGRLRLPALAILFLFSGYALAYITQGLQRAWQDGFARARPWAAIGLLVLWPVIGLALRTQDTAMLIGWNDHFNLAQAYEDHNDWASAVEHYERAMELAPEIELIHAAHREARARLAP